jgi:hypothetical protein
MYSGSGLIFCGTEGIQSRFHVLLDRIHFRQYRGRLVPISCFARPFSFSMVPRALGPVFMFCSSGLIFSCTEDVGCRFNVLLVRTHFRRYRGRRVPFSCFARPDSFSAVPRASAPVFMLCAPELVFGCTVRVRSRFHVLCSRTSFRRRRRRLVPFSCFAHPDSFSAVPMASGPVLMFCAPILFFSGIEGVRSRFHVLHARTHFGRYRGCQVPFSFYARPDSFSSVPRASVPVFMYCAHRLVFSSTEDVGSRFQVLRSMAHFRRYRGRRFTFSCFSRPDSFLAVLRESDPVFMFCAL